MAWPTRNSDASIFWTLGTFRTRAPDETWALIQPLLRKIGCTRVADLTHLDPTGISVHAAIRPLARSQTTAHGKGVSASLSRVSAAMAIQSRVAAIAGYRDDLPDNMYWTAKPRRSRAALPLDVAFVDPPASVPVRSLSDGVVELAKRIVDRTGYEPFVVILSEPSDPVAAVRVVAPGLRGHNMQGLRMPSRQP